LTFASDRLSGRKSQRAMCVTFRCGTATQCRATLWESMPMGDGSVKSSVVISVFLILMLLALSGFGVGGTTQHEVQASRPNRPPVSVPAHNPVAMCGDNRFVGNALGGNSPNANDDGAGNEWDANVWGDHCGTGGYAIPGEGGAIDDRPLQLDTTPPVVFPPARLWCSWTLCLPQSIIPIMLPLITGH